MLACVSHSFVPTSRESTVRAHRACMYIMVHYGALWCIMVHYGALWCIMVHYGALGQSSVDSAWALLSFQKLWSVDTAL